MVSLSNFAVPLVSVPSFLSFFFNIFSQYLQVQIICNIATIISLRFMYVQEWWDYLWEKSTLYRMALFKTFILMVKKD